MVANKACHLWANMVADLDVELIVPQHGSSFKGELCVQQFLNWISKLECELDLFTQRDYSIRMDKKEVT